MTTLVEELLRADALPAPAPGGVELAETHISWVFLAGDDVYKVKKPVDLGFLDFTTVERRRAACEAEVALNGRLAPDVYLGVEPVRRGADGRLRIGGEGEIVDWAVHMKRMPDDLRGDVLLARDGWRREDVDAVARALARFHAAARADEETGRHGSVEAIARNVSENFEATRGAVAAYVRPAEADEIERRQLGFLRDRRELVEARRSAGRVRDGHGDLRLEHVYLGDGRVTVLDCIEFNDRFRFADVCADVAFLAMDMASQGRVDLAERLLASYAREADDFDLYGVVDFYESYRAYVRAKIAMLVAGEPGVREDVRARLAPQARRLLLLALSSGRRALLSPTLVCVGGLIASGKSTLAERIATELCAPIVDADTTRKRMLGKAPEARLGEGAWAGAYDPAFTDRVYDEVLRRAGVVLASGRPVVVDASFRSRAFRGRARALASRAGVPFRFVECRAPESVCRDRLRAREGAPGVSDAREGLFDAFRARVEPVDELPPAEHVVVETAGPVDRALGEVERHVASWPRGLVR